MSRSVEEKTLSFLWKDETKETSGHTEEWCEGEFEWGRWGKWIKEKEKTEKAGLFLFDFSV